MHGELFKQDLNVRLNDGGDTGQPAFLYNH